MKRGRNCEDECCVPLSKRINNLHINGCCGAHPIQHTNEDNSEQWAAPMVAPSTSNRPSYASHVGNFLPNYAPGGDSTHQRYAVGGAGNAAVVPQEWAVNNLPQCPPYNPDLTETDNPYYYTKNQLLYELYMQRLQRAGIYPTMSFP